MNLQTYIFATLTSQPRCVRWDFYGNRAGHAYGYKPLMLPLQVWKKLIEELLDEPVTLVPAESHFWTLDRN